MLGFLLLGIAGKGNHGMEMEMVGSMRVNVFVFGFYFLRRK